MLSCHRCHPLLKLIDQSVFYLISHIISIFVIGVKGRSVDMSFFAYFFYCQIGAVGRFEMLNIHTVNLFSRCASFVRISCFPHLTRPSFKFCVHVFF